MFAGWGLLARGTGMGQLDEGTREQVQRKGCLTHFVTVVPTHGCLLLVMY